MSDRKLSFTAIATRKAGGSTNADSDSEAEEGRPLKQDHDRKEGEKIKNTRQENDDTSENSEGEEGHRNTDTHTKPANKTHDAHDHDKDKEKHLKSPGTGSAAHRQTAHSRNGGRNRKDSGSDLSDEDEAFRGGAAKPGADDDEDDEPGKHHEEWVPLEGGEGSNANDLLELPKTVSPEHFDYMGQFAVTKNGKVARARYKLTQQHYAIKIISKRKSRKGLSDAINLARNEIACLKTLVGCPFVAQLKQYFEVSRYVLIALELCPGGTVEALVNKRREDPERKKKQNYERYEAMCRNLAAELVMAVSTIHARGVVHGNLTPTNVLFSRQGHIRLVDFGLSYFIEENRPMNVENYCTHQQDGFVPPEVFRGDPLSPAADWWHVGVLLHLLLSPGHHPHEKQKKLSPFSDQKKKKPHKVGMMKRVSSDANDFVMRLLEPDPSRRMGVNGVEEVKSHVWFKGINFNQVSGQGTEFILTAVGGLSMPVFPTNENPAFKDLLALMRFERDQMKAQLSHVGII